MNTTAQTPASGKIPGMISLIIGIITLIWSLIPIIGALALWMAVIGFVLGLIGFVLAKKGNNPKKAVIIAGIILSVLAISLSGYWTYQVKKAADMLNKSLGGTSINK